MNAHQGQGEGQGRFVRFVVTKFIIDVVARIVAEQVDDFGLRGEVEEWIHRCIEFVTRRFHGN